MTIVEYLNSIKERLLTDSVVSGFRIVRERTTTVDGYLRACLTLTDDSWIEFSEYVQRSSDGCIHVITYSYHWADAHGNLIRRWDNTPHFPDLPGFPHHIHDGRTGKVNPGRPINIFVILDNVQMTNV